MTITSSSPFVMIKLTPWPLGLTTLLTMILFHGAQFTHRDGSVEAYHSSKVSNHFRDCYFFIAKTTRGGKIIKSYHCSYDKKEKYRRICSSFPLFDSNSSRDESEQGAGLSIGDVVQNLHGGKYQFSETQYLAGQSVIGQQFANELYSGSSECGNYSEGSDNEEEGNELPKWVKRLKDPNSHVGKPISEVLEFDSKNDRGVSSINIATISIKNEERSWEKYYAFIIPFLENVDRNGANAINQISQESGDFADNVKFQIISPKSGYLAPRGGASNACDESKPYSDGASVTIQWDGMIGEDYNSRRDDESSLLLVVGTEAEIWRYRLKVI